MLEAALPHPMTGTAMHADQTPAPTTEPSLTWRPAELDDVDGILALAHAADRLDHPKFLTSRDEIVDDLEASFVDRARDTTLAVDATTGEPVAYGVVVALPGEGEFTTTIVIAWVHPERRGRGIGRRILDWQLARAREQHRESGSTLPCRITVHVPDTATAVDLLVRAGGFAPARYFLDLEHALADVADVPSTPGYTLAPLDLDDLEALRTVKNASFQDHWGTLPESAEEWRQRLTRSSVRADLSVVATPEAGEVAGFCLCLVSPDDWAGQGFSSSYIELLGVTREHRGAGLGTAMLVQALHAARAEGLDRVTLNVDSASPTGATGLYAAAGFTPAGQTVTYTITLDPSATA